MASLAFESPMFLSILALLSGGVWLMFWTQQRAGYMLLLVAGWWGLCVYWGMLAISAGPAPILDRGDMAVAVRLVGLAAGMLLAAGKCAMLLCWRRHAQAAQG